MAMMIAYKFWTVKTDSPAGKRATTMQVDFQRTLRGLAHERKSTATHYLLLGILGLLFGGWFIWLSWARVPLYEVSTSARIETGEHGRPVETVLPGRVARVMVRLGEKVQSGAVLVELDDTAVHSRIKGATTELNALMFQLAARRKEHTLTEQLMEEREKQAEVNLGQARARREQSESASQLADYTAAQRKKLQEKGITSESDFFQSRSNAVQRQAELKAADLEIERLRAQKSVEQSEARTHLADLSARIAELGASIGRRYGELQSLRKELEDHRLRAAADGVIGELSEIRPGSFVPTGTRVATIVPTGVLRVIAEFVPARAIGLVVPGQSARIRLDGFPSTQYGTLHATVTDVAGEIRNGTIRVELALTSDRISAIPLQHGQPGEVEIVVGKVSPLELIVHTGARLFYPDASARALPVQAAANGSAK
jgi:membrane fusion protein (multidrug efflux system)